MRFSLILVRRCQYFQRLTGATQAQNSRNRGPVAKVGLAAIGKAGNSVLGDIRSEREGHAHDIKNLAKKAAELLSSLASSLQSGMTAQATAVGQVREFGQ